MRTLYLTSDRIGERSGGGSVTFQEMKALMEGFQTAPTVISREQLGQPSTVWAHDQKALQLVQTEAKLHGKFDLAHVYAGTYTRTVEYLKWSGTKVTYTAAAHSIAESKKAHEALGLPYDYPHLTDERLFAEYVRGYRLADLVIVPSKHSRDVMASYGCKNIQIIPHGVDSPKTTKPWPSRFTVGYLGSFGADKNLRHLLEAFKRFSNPSVSLLLGGKDSTSPWADALIRQFGGGNVHRHGWYEDVSDFYDAVTVLCVVSASEGFNCEVAEALAHGRMVVCSTGAGAHDMIDGIQYTLPVMSTDPYNPDLTVAALHELKGHADSLVPVEQARCRENLAKLAEDYQWPLIRERYQNAWRKLCSSP